MLAHGTHVLCTDIPRTYVHDVHDEYAETWISFLDSEKGASRGVNAESKSNRFFDHGNSWQWRL